MLALIEMPAGKLQRLPEKWEQYKTSDLPEPVA
jgi:hypothetical protein